MSINRREALKTVIELSALAVTNTRFNTNYNSTIIQKE